MTAAEWCIGRADAEPMPWGDEGRATAQFLAAADGYHLAVIHADAGYRGDPHDHVYAEFTFVVSGTVVTNGHRLDAGDAAAAPAGTRRNPPRCVRGTDRRGLRIAVQAGAVMDGPRTGHSRIVSGMARCNQDRRRT